MTYYEWNDVEEEIDVWNDVELVGLQRCYSGFSKFGNFEKRIQNSSTFFSQNCNPQNIFFLKTLYMLGGNGWLICVKIWSRYLQKWLEYDIKDVKKDTFHVISELYCDFPNFILWPILTLQKVSYGHFSRSLRTSDLKACIAALNHEIFCLTFLPGDLRWPWPVLWSQSTGNDTYRCQWYYPCRFIGFLRA